MVTSVTLDPPGTGKRCALEDQPSEGFLRGWRDKGDSGSRINDMITVRREEGERRVEERRAVSGEG